MARIRSIHPGLFTDESFVSCSPLARLLVLGLWTEADDQGVFEWKPVTLKMRLLPVDGADVSALLAEIAEQNIARRFEANGKQYGAIRNFRKYQRPKSPSAVHPLPAELRSYVAISEMVGDEPAPFPQKGEIAPQMEDGEGGEREEGNEDTGKPASSGAGPLEIDLEDAERRCCEAAGADRLGPFSPIAEILIGGKLDLDEVLTTIRARPARAGAVSSWKFYAKILNDRIAERTPSVASTGPPKVHVLSGTPEWDAWVAHEGKSHPLDSKGGWSFPTRWPPKIERAA